jgi:hypothetical protein
MNYTSQIPPTSTHYTTLVHTLTSSGCWWPDEYQSAPATIHRIIDFEFPSPERET